MARLMEDVYQHLIGNSRKARYNEALTRRKTRQLEALLKNRDALANTNAEVKSELNSTQQDLESIKGLAAHLRYEMKTILRSSLKAPGLRHMDVVAVSQSGMIYGQTARSRKNHGNLTGKKLERYNYEKSGQAIFIDGKFYTLVLEPITQIRGETHQFGYIKKPSAEKRFKRALRYGGQELTDAIAQVVGVSKAKVEGHVYK